MNNMNTLDLNLVSRRFGAESVKHVVFARCIAFEIDEDPFRINRYHHEPTIEFISADRDSTTLERTKFSEVVGYGDANVFLALPNPSLAGGVLREMGDVEHLNYFFDYVRNEKCTTFAGITEPQHGSDVASIETSLKKVNEDKYVLNGEKVFITHGYDGKIAVLIARTSPGPLGITGIILTQEDLEKGEKDGTVSRELLPVVGMKGTCLSRLVFKDFSISSWNLLGQHLRSTRRGMMSVIKTFNRMRPCVAGFVIGQGQAIVDYMTCCFNPLSVSMRRALSLLNAELASAQKTLYESAVAIDNNPLDPGLVSLSKAKITCLVEKIFSIILNGLDCAIFVDHPLLLKWFRDIYGFEYMEGTTDMQKRNVYQKFLRQRSRSA